MPRSNTEYIADKFCEIIWVTGLIFMAFLA